MAEARDHVKGSVPEFAKFGKKLDRAVDAVLAGGVKEARFIPSGRRVVTVVGRLGDEFIDPERPYCSCSDFYFHVTRGKDETCYHLLSYRIAEKLSEVDVLEFADEEYGPYLAATVQDVFRVLEKSGG
jgi:predicted nucleic acid-binding Zn finger protein